MERRFVIQIHRGWGPTHFDLMVEDGATLATWQFAISPADAQPGDPLACKRIADHRPAYLTYEGPVSRGRGEVHIQDRGTCEVLQEGEGHRRIRFEGARLSATAELKRTGDGWSFELEPAR